MAIDLGALLQVVNLNGSMIKNRIKSNQIVFDTCAKKNSRLYREMLTENNIDKIN